MNEIAVESEEVVSLEEDKSIVLASLDEKIIAVESAEVASVEDVASNKRHRLTSEERIVRRSVILTLPSLFPFN